MPDETKQIAFRGTDEYREFVQRASLDRKMKVQQFLEAAVEHYVKDKSGRQPVAVDKIKAPLYRPENRTIHEQLEAVLNSGERDMLATMIEKFYTTLPRNARRGAGS